MAKRANPFVDDFIPQSKKHVGMKQFNNNEERLQQVYDKTLALLFQGAKKVDTVTEVTRHTVVGATKREGNLKQLFIGKDGSLLHTGCLESSSVPKLMKQCVCGGEAEGGCAYCERRLCGACRCDCELCLQPYCAPCTLTGSEGSTVCVSCYR